MHFRDGPGRRVLGIVARIRESGCSIFGKTNYASGDELPNRPGREWSGPAGGSAGVVFSRQRAGEIDLDPKRANVDTFATRIAPPSTDNRVVLARLSQGRRVHYREIWRVLREWVLLHPSSFTSWSWAVTDNREEVPTPLLAERHTRVSVEATTREPTPTTLAPRLRRNGRARGSMSSRILGENRFQIGDVITCDPVSVLACGLRCIRRRIRGRSAPADA
jgi:hypothetical protein